MEYDHVHISSPRTVFFSPGDNGKATFIILYYCRYKTRTPNDYSFWLEQTAVIYARMLTGFQIHRGRARNWRLREQIEIVPGIESRGNCVE